MSLDFVGSGGGELAAWAALQKSLFASVDFLYY